MTPSVAAPGDSNFSDTTKQVYFYGPLYISLSVVTFPLHRYKAFFATNGAFLPPCTPSVGSAGWSAPALGGIPLQGLG